MRLSRIVVAEIELLGDNPPRPTGLQRFLDGSPEVDDRGVAPGALRPQFPQHGTGDHSLCRHPTTVSESATELHQNPVP